MQKYIFIILGLSALAAARSLTGEKLLQEMRELAYPVARDGGEEKPDQDKGKSENGEKEDRVGRDLLDALSNFIHYEISEQEGSKGGEGQGGEGTGGEKQDGKEAKIRKRTW